MFVFLCALMLSLSAQSFSETTLQSSSFAEQKKDDSFFELMGNLSTQLTEADAQELNQLSADYRSRIGSIYSVSINHIPKHIHVIWIGPKPFPEKSVPNMLSWQKNHPEWTMYFWTDLPERQVPIAGMVKQLVQEYDFSQLAPLIAKSTNWGEKADMMRYMILYQEGGVYVDHDMWSEQSLELLLSHFDFVAGCDPLQPHPVIESNVIINNSILISRPYHPILAQTIKQVIAGWDAITEQYPVTDPKSEWNRVMRRTFAPFLQSVKLFRNTEGNNDIVLPAIYLYSHNMFSKETFQQFRSEGYVFAIHKHGI